MEHTLVAAFDSEAHAQNALNDLVSAGFSRNDIHINASQQNDTIGKTSSSVGGAASDHQSIGEKIKSFFHNMFGGEDTAQADIYSEAVRRGGYVLTVMARDDDQVRRASDVLNRHNPIDMEERTEQWKSTGWIPGASIPANASGARSDTESTAIPVVEEQLRVGKRAVQRGGVRVVQRVTEKPVQESVQLHEERVNVERHPVDQPASAADMAALKEGSLEVRETVEEPVVGKTARVVEEVVVSKEVGDRTETVKDTVRGTEVEVEQLGARKKDSAQSGMPMDDSDFRTHWQSSYSQSGGRYEDYAPAYQYGSTLGADERYRGRRWNDVEPQARTDWEAKNAGSPWEKAKDAVRVGWEKVAK
jgi:uncharacterized protein (TIGR02271 family)